MHSIKVAKKVASRIFKKHAVEYAKTEGERIKRQWRAMGSEGNDVGAQILLVY